MRLSDLLNAAEEEVLYKTGLDEEDILLKNLSFMLKRALNELFIARDLIENNQVLVTAAAIRQLLTKSLKELL